MKFIFVSFAVHYPLSSDFFNIVRGSPDLIKTFIFFMTDPIADYLTRLRNAIMAHHRVVEVPASNFEEVYY